MLSSGACPGSPFAVYPDRWLQMDRVYCSKDEDEEKEEDRRLGRSQGDLEECVRAVCPANSWRLGIRELLFCSVNFSHLTNIRHRPRLWTTGLQCLKQNSMRQSLQLSIRPVTYRP